MAGDVDQNYAQLQALYRIVTPKDLIGRYDVGRISTLDRPDPDILGKILDVLVNTTDSSGSGLLLFDEIKQQLDSLRSVGAPATWGADLGDQLDKHVKLVEPSEGLFGKLRPSKTDARIRVISLRSPMLGVSLRDVNRAGLFLNAVPTLELSRCVPLLEVGFELAFPGDNGDGTGSNSTAAQLSARSPTLLRYLVGDSTYGDADVAMAKGSVHKVDLASRANDRKEQESWRDSAYVTSGMELFTSPQTLATPDGALAGRQTPILDRFAPLMSIESFEITTSGPVAGTFAFKTARLNLVVHDRSRLNEAAALIKPDAYSRTTVSITYGWSHPDRSGADPIADLINSMVVRDEKYNVVNSSFTFSGGGGVRVTLQLATKGANETATVRIADDPKFSDLNVHLQELADAIREAKASVPGLTKPDYVTEDVRVYQIIDAAANNAELIDNYQSERDRKQLRALVSSLQRSKANQRNPAALQQLKDFMSKMDDFLTGAEERSKLFAVDNKKTNARPLVDHVLGERFRVMIGQNDDGTFGSAPDPFLDLDAAYWTQRGMQQDLDDLRAQASGKSKNPRKYVSLAKLLAFYVGMPLQSLKGAKVDEVQFVFYPLNVDAGFAGGTDLGAFPVDVQYFRDVLADHAKRRGNANLSVREFVQLLASSVLQDVRSPAYGLRDFYVSRDPGKPLEQPALKTNKSPVDVTDRLKNAPGGGAFRKPAIEVQIDCRGGKPLLAGETARDKSHVRILRIHVYDKLSSAYEPTLKVLEAQRGLTAVHAADSTARQQIADILAQLGIPQKEGRFSSQRDLKRFVSQVVPVLTYGSNASGITAATMQTLQNSDLATVNMQRAMGPQYNSEPNGPSTSAVPMRVQPTQLDLTLIGCPLVNFAQQYFVEFGTGTTIDNLYGVTSVGHKISAGKFETTAKLTAMDAYGSFESIQSKVRQLKDEVDALTQQVKTAQSG